MSEHAYVVLFVSVHACGRAHAAHECVNRQMHVSWCTFTCICEGVCICVCACKGEDLEHRGAGGPGNAIHFHLDVDSVLSVYQCVWREGAC